MRCSSPWVGLGSPPTGVRIGEALAVRWEYVDLRAGVVVVDHTVIRVKGVGLVRKSTKPKPVTAGWRYPSGRCNCAVLGAYGGLGT